MNIRIIAGILIFFSIGFFTGCSDDGNPPPMASVNIMVRAASNSAPVPGANVVLFNAANGNSIRRASTGPDGSVSFANLDPGTFFVNITAQNFSQLPPENITPVPFSASAGGTASMTYYLNAYPVQTGLGKISGTVNPKLPGILIKAVSGSGSSYSTYTGPDGYYVLFNLPYETYTLSAYRQGFMGTTEPQVEVSQNQMSPVQDIIITALTGSRVSGSVTFLAVENGIVDVTLLDRNTKSAVNGLSTVINESRLYNLTGIPKGQFLAWASFKNDGYVMDPDWIFKNPGALNVDFTADTASKVLNFSVTGAINIIAPTNPADTIIPVLADSTSPLFSWSAYPQAKEYIIEVKDLNGNIIWGGYNIDGTIRHAVISKDVTSIRFNFDGSASSQLVPGEIYQWKIYADDDANPNIQTLLSSSEDLRGLFRIK